MIVVPALVLLFELGDVTAKGTSLLVVLPTAVVGTLRNLRNDNVDLRGALVIGAGGMLSAFGGGMLAGVIPSGVSSALFAGLLIVIALRMIRDMLRESGRPDDRPDGSRGPGGGSGRLV